MCVQKLVVIEHTLTGTSASAAASGGLSSPSTSGAHATDSAAASNPQWDVCLYAEAQRAAGQLRDLAPFFKQYGTRGEAQIWKWWWSGGG